MSDKKPEQAKTDKKPEQTKTDQTPEQAKTDQLQVPSPAAGAEGGKSPDSTESSPKRPKRSVVQSLRNMASPKSDSKLSVCKCESQDNHDVGCPRNQKKPQGNKSPIKSLIGSIATGAQNVLDKLTHKKKRDSLNEELFDEEAYKTAVEPEKEKQESDSSSVDSGPRLKPLSLSDISRDPFEDKSKSSSVSSMRTNVSDISSNVFASSLSSPSAPELSSTVKEEESKEDEQAK